MENFQQTQELVTKSTQSAGSAMEKFNIYQESTSAGLERVRNQAEILATNVIDGKLIKSIILLTEKFLEFTNTGLGTFLIQTTLVITTITVLTQLFAGLGASIKKLVMYEIASNMAIAAKNAYTLTKAFGSLSVANGMMTASNLTLVASFEALKAAFYSLPIIGQVALAITALVGVVGAAVKVYDHYNESLEEHKERIANLQNEYNQAKSNVESLKSELEQVNAKIEEINKNNLVLTPNAEEELQNLKNYSDELNRQLEIEKALAEIRGKELDTEAKIGLEKTKTLGIADSALAQQLGIGKTVDTGSITGIKIEVTELENFQLLTYRYEEIIKTSKELEEQKKRLEAAGQKESDAYKQVVKEIEANSAKQKILSTDLQNSYDTLKLYNAQLLNTNEESKAYKNTIASLFDEFIKISTVEKPNLSLDLGGMEESKASFNSLKKVVDDISDKNKTLSSAFEELNSDGKLSAETFSELAETLDNNGKYLDVVGGKLIFNSEKYYEDTKAVEENIIATNNKTIADKNNTITLKQRAIAQGQNASVIVKEIAQIEEEIKVLEAENAVRKANMQNMYDQIYGLEALGGQVDDIVKSYNSLNSIVDEYNENGEISLESLKSLLELDPSYIAALDIQNDKLVLSKINTENLVKAMKLEYQAKLQSAYASDVAAIANGKYSETSDLAKSVTGKFEDSLNTLPSKLSGFAGGLLKAATGLSFYAKKAREATNLEEPFAVPENLAGEALKEVEALSAAYQKINQFGQDIAVGNISSSSYKSEKKAKSITELVTNLIDKWIVADNKLKDIEHSLETIHRLNENIDKSSEGYIYNLNKELDLLNEKQKILNEQNIDRRKTMAETAKEISKLTGGKIAFDIKGNEVSFKQTGEQINAVINALKAGTETDTNQLRKKVADAVETMNDLEDAAKSTSEEFWEVQDAINKLNLEFLTYDIEEFINKNEKSINRLNYALNGLGENDFDKKLILLNQELAIQTKTASFLEKEMAELTQAFKDGKISVVDYKEQMSEYQDQALDTAISQQQLTQNIKETIEAQSQAQVDAYKEYYELVKEYYLQGVNDQIEALEDLNDAHKDEIDALKDTLDAQKEQTKDAIDGLEEQLDLQKQLYDAEIAKLDLLKKQRDEQDTLDEFNKEITKLEQQIETLTGDDKSNATRLKLEEELTEKRAELEKYLFDQDIENRKSSLEASLKADEAEIESKKKQQEKILELVEQGIEAEIKYYEDMIKKNELEIEKLQDSIKNAGQVSIDVINLINTGGKDLFDKLQSYSTKYKDVFEDNALDTITQFKENWNDTIPTLETVLQLSKEIAQITSMGVGYDLSNMEISLRDALSQYGEVGYNSATKNPTFNGTEFNASDFNLSLINDSYVGNYSDIGNLLNSLGVGSNLYSNAASGFIGAAASNLPLNTNNNSNVNINNEINVSGLANGVTTSDLQKAMDMSNNKLIKDMYNNMTNGGMLKRSRF